jgi:hypothetical protein
MKITTAGNIVIPAIKLIKDLGFHLKVEDGFFSAKKGDDIFMAEDPIRLLGLIKLIEAEGENWRISDDEIETIGREYNIL